jgi:hypothetical protein
VYSPGQHRKKTGQIMSATAQLWTGRSTSKGETAHHDRVEWALAGTVAGQLLHSQQVSVADKKVTRSRWI